MTLTLGQLPAAYFSYSTPTCAKTDVLFTDQSRVSNGYINKWVWDFGDGNTKTIVFPNSPDVSHTFTTPGPSYNVKLKVFTSLGCTTEFTNVVTSTEAPVANFSFPDILCDNQPVQFTNTSQINGALGMQPWSWEFGDPLTGVGNTSNLENPAHQFSSSGNYIVKLTVLNSNNCLNTFIDTINVKLRPSVDFSFGKTCLNEQVLFDPDPIKTDFNSISSWLWDFGDGVTSNIRNTVHIYNAPGIYSVTLKVTDLTGCTNTISHSVIVNPLPKAHFDPSIIDCENSIVLFNELTSTSEGYIVKWVWDFGDGTSQTVNYPDNANVTHKYSKPGQYDAKLSVLTSVGCSNFELQVVTILPSPVANFSFSTSCMNKPVLFTDLSQNNASGDIVKWDWNFGDVESGVNNVSTLKNPSHNYVATGSFNVTLVVTNNKGCKNTLTQKVVINPKPSANFTPSVTRCEGDVVTFINSSSTPVNTMIVSSLWDFGDNIPSSEFSPSHKFFSYGTFPVKLIIYNSIGCTDTLIQQVTLNPKPIVDFSTSEIKCTGSTVTFSDHSYLPTGFTGSIKTWAWDFGDGTPVVSVDFPSNPNIPHTFAGTATSFTVKLTVTSTTGCTGFIEKVVSLIPSPKANFVNSNALCNNSQVSFTDLSSENGGGKLRSWSWNFGDPLSGASNTSTQQNPTHSFMGAGSYRVTLTVSNPNGCTNTFSQTIVVLNSNPVAKFTPSVTRCEGEVLNFNNESITPTGTNITSNLWNFGDNITSLVSSPSHTFANSGIFPVKLVITNSNGCRDSVLQQVIVNPKPVVDFSLSEIRCVDSPINFTDHSYIPAGFTGSIKTWTWEFGDQSIPVTVNYPMDPNVPHTFTGKDTVFMVKLSVISTTGCTAYNEKRIRLKPSPVAKFITSSNLCDNQIVRFRDLSGENGGGKIDGWNWNFGDPSSIGNNTSTQQNPSHAFTATGSSDVALTVTNINGCTNTVSSTVVLGLRVDAKFTVSTKNCEGEQVSFSDESITPTGTAITSYKWNFGDGETSSLVSPTHVYKSYGTYTATLSVVNSGGCTASATQQVVVTPKPVAEFSFSQLRCSGDPVTFIDHSYVTAGFNGFINKWEWNFGDGTTPVTVNYPSKVNIVHTFAAGAASYKVRLTVTTSNGCSAFTDTVIAVTTAGFIGTYGPYCLSDSPVKLSVEPTGGTFIGPGVQGNYFYPMNAGVSNPNSPHTIIYMSPTGSCPVAPINIEVVSLPVVKTTPLLLASCNGTADLTLSSATVGSTAGLHFTYFTDEQALRPVVDPKAVTLGTYYIRGATLSGKCATIQSVTVSPSEPLQAKFSTIVSPACSGSASGSITVKAVNGASPFSYQLNSNPAQTSPTFTGLRAGNYSITITDGNSCTVTRDTIIRDNPNAKIFISHKNIACSNDANGSARVDSINGNGKASILGSYNYSWNSSPVQTTREAVQLGNRYYTVTVTDSKGCGIKDSVYIAVMDTIAPRIVCRADTVSIILQAGVNDPLSNTATSNEVAVELVKPTVSDNCDIDTLTNDAPAKFRVGVVTPVVWTVTDLVGLTATCTSYVYVKRIPIIPKLLTPNGDGLNDKFEIDGLEDFPKSQLSIFARSGQLVFSSEDYKNEWDCRFTTSKWSNNQFVSPGVYYYVLNLGGTKQKLQGYIYVSY
jgi:gliding motility-associated-like protein